ncbi:hypothetical protein QCM77_34925 [Bradyrhizobium sp. SSUT18]|nr:hypothetical protein [Bradyrhizobium sp. SSUT18]MDH2405074.1 hypothetical protein [Bradyrhizobium sp. SSUT18]
MSVKAMTATILQEKMMLRGVHSLRRSDYEEVVIFPRKSGRV